LAICANGTIRDRRRDREGSPMQASPSGTAARVGIMAFSFAACLVPVFAPVVPPMTDLGSHVLVARILSHYGDPTLRFAEFFTIDWTVAPTALSYVLLGWLEQVFGPYGGAKAYLAIWLALLGASMALMARSLGSRDAWGATLLALPLSFSWFVWMGFLPFVMSMPLFAATLGVWWSPLPGRWKVPLMWALLALLFGFHIIGLCAAVGAVAASWLWQAYSRDPTAPSFGRVCLVLWPAAAFLGAYLLGPRPPSVGWTYEGALDQVYSLFTFTWGSLTESGRLLLVAWIVGVIGATVWTGWRRQLPMRAAVAALALAAVGVIVPVYMGAILPAGPRMFPFALMLCIASIRWSARASRLAAVGSALLLAALSLATTVRVLEIDRDYRAFMRTVAGIAPGSRVLPIIGDVTAGSAMTWPYAPFMALAPIERGGLIPYAFASPYIFTNATPLRYAQEPGPEMRALFDPGSKPAAFSSLAGRYDYVIAWDLPVGLRDEIDAAFQEVGGEGRARLFVAR
jgi:hypothetical protein